MPYQRKTADEFDLQADYGHGWEVIDCHETHAGAVAARKAYRENGDHAPMRIVHHRVKIERV